MAAPLSAAPLPTHVCWNGLNRFWTTVTDAQGEVTPANVSGEYLLRTEEGSAQSEMWYKISNYDRMPPFFISLVSDSNHWVFVSTTGGLTCGRVSAEHSLFPYYTVDKIHDSHSFTGPRTIFHICLPRSESEEDYARLVEEGSTSGAGMASKVAVFFWEPFARSNAHPYKIVRNIYKVVVLSFRFQ